MADKKFSLLELHLHDSSIQFGPSSLRTGGAGSEPSDSDETEPALDSAADAADESGRSGLGPLLGLGALAVAGYAVKKLFSSSDDGYEGMDNVEDLGVVSGSRQDEGDETDIEVTDEEEGRSKFLPLLGLSVLGAVLVTAWKLLGGDDDLDALESLDDLADEQ